MSAGRFMLFDIPAHYPVGGIEDLKGRFGSVEEAMEQLKEWEDGQIYDVELGILVATRFASGEWTMKGK